MFTRVRILAVLLFLAVMAGTALAQAQEPVFPNASDPTWRASYWNNTTFSGTPVLVRSEIDLNHDWGTGSPHAVVNTDGFSARWSRYLHLAADTCRFTAASDDGIRVWVDGDLIIDEWRDQAVKTVSADKRLNSGHHWVEVEYYESQGAATAKLTWQSAVASVRDWRGEYFDNVTLSGTPALIRADSQIDFDWGALSPDPDLIGVDRFSARWTRTAHFPAGWHRFAMTVDDGARLWVNDHLLIASWQEQPATIYTEDVYLPGGDVPLEMEYYENGGIAVAKLSWEVVTPSAQNWHGEFFNNTSLHGTPHLVRDDAAIDFDWGAGSPAEGIIDADGFSVRWTRTLELPAGRYRFETTVDDGVRLWVKGHLLIDAWYDQAARTHTAEIDLSGDPVPIKMEYYENSGQAVARLSWVRLPDPTPNHDWYGEYFDNATLSGAPALIRDDVRIDFDWGAGSPASGVIGADEFSARWTRILDLSAGRYRFEMTVDDGARLRVNGHLLVEAWYDQAARTHSAEIDLPDGPITVQMEYYEHSGLAVARLSWSEIAPPPPSGTVTVDNTDPGFEMGGSPSGMRAADGGYGGSLLWTRNNDWQRPDYNWARWSPSLAAGNYEVFVFIPDQYTTTSSARYTILHAGGFTSRVVNQSTNGGSWVSLGTYWFDATHQGSVSLTDVTGEARLSTLVAYDTVKWVAT